MSESVVRMSVPAEPTYARSVRMMAANLAMLCSMNVDDVEDARMAAEEAFVYACATRPGECSMTFRVCEGSLRMSFGLGDFDPSEDDALAEQVSFAELLLSSVCDSYEFADDGTSIGVLKRAGGAHAE